MCLTCHDGTSKEFTDRHLGLTGDRIDCRKCHDPHGGAGKSLMLPGEHEPFLSGDCSLCHPAAGGKEGGQ